MTPAKQATRQDYDGAAGLADITTIKCAGCGATQTVHAPGLSVTLACTYCGSLIDLVDPRFRLIEKADQVEKQADLLIPLGTKGKLDNITWKVIGWTERSDETGAFIWQEYLLFNPYRGYRFLVNDRGHWLFGGVFVVQPEFVHGNLQYYTNRYKRFQGGKSVVKRVLGEFYWRVKRGEATESVDYICPPYQISIEGNASETNFTHLRYVERREVSKAFGISWLPYTSGIAPAQPNPHNQNLKTRVILALIFCVAAIFVHASMSIKDKTLYGYAFELTPNDKGVSLVLPQLTIPQPGPIWLDARSAINNSWAEISYDLTNMATGESFSLTQPIEYYHGVDGGESWSEGSQTAHSPLSNLPAGQYTVQAQVESNVLSNGQNLPLRLTIRTGYADSLNLIIAFVLLFLLPVIQLIRCKSFETERWKNSDMAED